MLGLAAAGGLPAQDEDPGSFEVRAASHELIDGTYFVDAVIDLRLPTEAANALHSRLPLTIRVEVEFLNRLRLWWDPVEFEASRRSQLMYYQLTDRYVVTHIDSGDREDFVTLAGALEFVGRVDRLRVVDEQLLDRDRRYEVRVRAVLDTDELPGPLRLLAFWRRDWSIASDWLLWRLDED
jgi:hypothetical protein